MPQRCVWNGIPDSVCVCVCASCCSCPAPTQWSPWPLPFWLRRSGLKAGQCWPQDWRSWSPPSTRGGAASSASRRHKGRRYSVIYLKIQQNRPLETDTGVTVFVAWGSIIVLHVLTFKWHHTSGNQTIHFWLLV